MHARVNPNIVSVDNFAAKSLDRRDVLGLQADAPVKNGSQESALMRLPRFPFAMLRASAHRNDSGMEDGRAMTREGTGSI
jgi:hypothetical protein